MAQSISKIRADFDRIALLPEIGWGHNEQYHSFLLEQLPRRCDNALEIGCGTGAFSRLLARRSERVLALDLSPRMIQIARERSEHYPNIDYRIADATTWEFPGAQFDCVVSIATLHHLPIEEMLSKMKDTLNVNGTLIVLDLFQEKGLADALTSILAALVSRLFRLIKTGRLAQSRQEREAWAEHGQNDSYLTLSQVRQVCASLLPRAKVRRHLLWRYSITWKKSA